MIALEEARERIAAACAPADHETVPLAEALGRICAQDVIARISCPPADLSAMDGYAVRHDDCERGNVLEIIGESRAGAPFAGRIEAGQATLISTGAHLPEGADHVLILEDAVVEGQRVTIRVDQPEARNIRRAGIDFGQGDVLLLGGDHLNAARLALAAAGGHGAITASRRPDIAILTNGDELLDPGTAPGPASVYDSNAIALAAQFTGFGAQARWVGRAGDDTADVEAKLAQADGADLLVIAGGASVGPHDLVKGAFAAQGGELIFSKVAVRPGKPVWFGRLPSGTLVLGLPGNPASSYVTALLFGKLAVERLSGLPSPPCVDSTMRTAITQQDLAANGPRDAFLRAALTYADDGTTRISLTGSQDSSLLRPLAAADGLLFRKANAPAVQAEALVSYWPL